jgi:hypothetical protein
MSNSYTYALKIWLREDRYNEMIKGTTHKELENTLQEVCQSGPVTVIPYRDKLLALAYTATYNRLQGVQFAIWNMWIEKYPEVTHPEDLAQIVDHIVEISTPEVLEKIEKNFKTLTSIFTQLVLPWYKQEKRKNIN